MNKFALLLALLVTATAQAEIYRWVDENGVTVYSETPPPDGEATTVRTAPSPSESPMEAQRRLDDEMQKLEDYREDKALVAEEKKKEDLSKQLNEQNCRNAKANLDNLNVAAQRLVRMPDGSYVRLPEEQRQKRMEEARNNINKYCK